jgi:hypothetical protein
MYSEDVGFRHFADAECIIAIISYQTEAGFVGYNAERKTKLDSGCSLQAEKGRKNTAVVKQEKRDAWTNFAPRSDALNQTDPVERVM